MANKVFQQSLKDIFDQKFTGVIEKKAKDILLSNFFEDKDWKSMEVSGNGLCLFYAIMAADQSEYECSIKDDVIESFSKMVVDGIENYYKARKQHELLKINVPDILKRFEDFELNFLLKPDWRAKPPDTESQDIKDEWDEWYRGYQVKDAREADNLVSIKKENFMNPEIVENEKLMLKNKIKQILTSEYFNNSPEDLFLFLGYANNSNILYFDYKFKVLNFLFYPCLTDVTIENEIPVYPYENNTTILFNYSVHFFPLFHANNTIKKNTIDLFKKIIEQEVLLFIYDSNSGNFIRNKKPQITFEVAIQEAKAAMEKEVKPEVKYVKEVKEVKSSVKQLLKSMMLDLFEQRRAAEGEAGGEAGEAAREEE